MTTKKTVTTITTPGPNYFPNAQPSLRALFIHIDEKTGHTITIDRAVLGWAFGQDTPPQPVVVGGVPRQASLTVIRDDTTKTWVNPRTGETFTEWRDVVGPLYAEHDKRPKEAPPPLTEPAVGEVDHWGVGIAPQPWKAGR